MIAIAVLSWQEGQNYYLVNLTALAKLDTSGQLCAQGIHEGLPVQDTRERCKRAGRPSRRQVHRLEDLTRLV